MVLRQISKTHGAEGGVILLRFAAEGHTYVWPGPRNMYKKLVFCTIVRPYVVYVILPSLRPPKSEKAGNLPGFGHTIYGGGPHTLYGGSAIHCMSQAPYIVRARPRTLYETGPEVETRDLEALSRVGGMKRSALLGYT